MKRTQPIHIHYIPHILTPSVYDKKLHFFAKKMISSSPQQKKVNDEANGTGT